MAAAAPVVGSNRFLGVGESAAHTAKRTSSRLLGFTARIFMRVYVFESTWRGINGERRGCSGADGGGTG